VHKRTWRRLAEPRSAYPFSNPCLRINKLGLSKYVLDVVAQEEAQGALER
jgi:hypothetical protein